MTEEPGKWTGTDAARFVDAIKSPLYHRDRYQALDRAARGFIEAYEGFGGEWFNEAPDQVYDAYERLKEALDA